MASSVFGVLVSSQVCISTSQAVLHCESMPQTSAHLPSSLEVPLFTKNMAELHISSKPLYFSTTSAPQASLHCSFADWNWCLETTPTRVLFDVCARKRADAAVTRSGAKVALAMMTRLASKNFDETEHDPLNNISPGSPSK